MAWVATDIRHSSSVHGIVWGGTPKSDKIVHIYIEPGKAQKLVAVNRNRNRSGASYNRQHR
jgi:hypothetical protein